MDTFFFVFLFILALPGLPVSVPLLLWMFRDLKHGNSGAIGATFLVSGACGLVGWLIILAFVIGRALGA